jgi:hypothetical protein
MHLVKEKCNYFCNPKMIDYDVLYTKTITKTTLEQHQQIIWNKKRNYYL